MARNGDWDEGGRLRVIGRRHFAGIRAAGAMRLVVACIFAADSSVEPMVIVAPALVPGAPVAPAPGLRAVWNDLTPLVSSAMQRFNPYHAPGTRERQLTLVINSVPTCSLCAARLCSA